MRLLHILAPGDFGGLERVVQALALGQARTGDEVHVAAVLERAGAAHPLLHALATGGVTTHPLVVPARAYWQERAALVALCRRLGPAVVHTHGFRPDIVDGGVVRRLGIPTVTTAHGFTGGDWKMWLYERLQRRAYRRFDAVVAVSRPLRERLIQSGVPPQRIHCVQNAWQETTPALDRRAARHALDLDQDEFIVGWAGRVSSEKGPDVLLDALVHLTDLPLSVAMVGDGPERRSLEMRARRSGVERQVRWHGVVPDAGRLFSAFDVFVLSSRTEGTPIVLFEAMAAGVPIVAAEVGGVPDVVSTAEAALVRPDEPLALATEIRALYHHAVLRRERAQRAHARLLRDFTLPPWLARYDAIYRLVSHTASIASCVA
jgi:glycosyltransferase involved in cell wall biosynthesis